jgi:hypothetical protein
VSVIAMYVSMVEVMPVVIGVGTHRVVTALVVRCSA